MSKHKNHHEKEMVAAPEEQEVLNEETDAVEIIPEDEAISLEEDCEGFDEEVEQ